MLEMLGVADAEVSSSVGMVLLTAKGSLYPSAAGSPPRAPTPKRKRISMSRVAVVQATPVLFDTPKTISKAIDLIAECSRGGAEFAVFPEAFIGGYPKGMQFGTTLGMRTEEGRKVFARYARNAVELHGPEMQFLCGASAENNVFVMMGIIERLGNTLYCSVASISPEKGIVGVRRKLMPTALERLIWGFGDGSTMEAVDTPVGRAGAVICWENYMPLLRQSMYSQGIEIYCAPTVDDRPIWQASMTHIALEGRVFVLSACQYLTREDFAEVDRESLHYVGDTPIRGGSVIIDPLGRPIAGPVYDQECTLFADIDLSIKTGSHLDFDPVGHYSRPDIFTLHVERSPRNSVVDRASVQE